MIWMTRQAVAWCQISTLRPCLHGGRSGPNSTQSGLDEPRSIRRVVDSIAAVHMARPKSYIGRFRGTTSPRAVLDALRVELPTGEIAPLIDEISSNRYIAARTFQAPAPASVRQLDAATVLRPRALSRELRWAGAYLRRHVAAISEFLTLRETVVDAGANASPDAARIALDEIESRVGQSHWLINARLCNEQALGGLPAQRKYLADIIAAAASGSLTAYIAYYASRRNEPAMRPSRFRANTTATLSDKKFDGRYRRYIASHLIPDDPAPTSALPEILALAECHSVVDYVEALLYACGRLAAGPASPEREIALDVVLTLLESIPHARLLDLAVTLANGEHSDDAPDPIEEAIELVLRGEYALACSLAVGQLQGIADRSERLVVACRASTGAPGDAGTSGFLLLAERCGRALAGSRQDLEDLDRFVLNQPRSVLSVAVSAIAKLGRPADYATSYELLAEATTSARAAMPLWLGMVGTPDLRRQMLSRSPTLRNPVAQGVVEAYLGSDEPSSGSAQELDLIRLERLLEGAQFVAAANVAKRLAQADRSFHRRRGIRGECLAILGQGLPSRACEIAVQHCLADAGNADIVPLRNIIDGCKPLSRTVLAAEVYWPIILDLYNTFVSKDLDSHRVFAYIRLLRSHNVRRASDLLATGHSFQSHQLVYFLRNVCVESVMDRSGLFESSVDVLQERLTICTQLVSLDRAEAATYHAELQVVSRRLMLRRRMREVELSKIYVDLESVRRTLSVDVQDQFMRCGELAREKRSDQIVKLIEDALRKWNQSGRGSIKLAIPPDELVSEFAAIARRCRDEYALSAEHGLDKYLSVKIRHGTLTAFLQKPLEQGKLLVSRESSADSALNSHWRKRLSINSWQVKSVVGALTGFSASFGNLLEEIKSQLQVATEAKPGGLFQFALDESSIATLQNRINIGDATFDEFVEFMLSFFGQVLDHNLGAVRTYLTDAARARAVHLLDELEAKVEAVQQDGELAPLTAAVRAARTDLQVAFARVSEWFRRERTSAAEPFIFDEVLETAIESVKALAPAFTVKKQVLGEPQKLLAGRQFALLVDLLFTVLENVVKHSRLQAPEADVQVLLSGDLVAVSVENSVSDSVVPAEQEPTLKRLHSELAQWRSSQAATREGGTGFHKIVRILSHDFGVTPDLTFGFRDAKSFFVKFSTRVKVLPDETANS